MTNRYEGFETDEWYHCFTRGVDKRVIFLDEHDYERYLMLLYACNNTERLHISNIGGRHQGPTLVTVMGSPRGDRLVDIGAYCLMPNHVHLLLRETTGSGISLFMQKVGTGYTMYFNKKYGRTGALLSSRFKALHVSTDQYLRRVTNYIHANPAELYEPAWKQGVIQDRTHLQSKLLAYEYSSLRDYEGVQRHASLILEKEALLSVTEDAPSFQTLLEDAEIYYGTNESDMTDF